MPERLWQKDGAGSYESYQPYEAGSGQPTARSLGSGGNLSAVAWQSH
ncbi:MAG: hypothetical protein WAL64_01415 [Candidatus Dormiibacterota bacterium]